jgi:hypothetical protein
MIGKANKTAPKTNIKVKIKLIFNELYFQKTNCSIVLPIQKRLKPTKIACPSGVESSSFAKRKHRKAWNKKM